MYHSNPNFREALRSNFTVPYFFESSLMKVRTNTKSTFKKKNHVSKHVFANRATFVTTQTNDIH